MASSNNLQVLLVTYFWSAYLDIASTYKIDINIGVVFLVHERPHPNSRSKYRPTVLNVWHSKHWWLILWFSYCRSTSGPDKWRSQGTLQVDALKLPPSQWTKGSDRAIFQSHEQIFFHEPQQGRRSPWWPPPTGLRTSLLSRPVSGKYGGGPKPAHL